MSHTPLNTMGEQQQYTEKKHNTAVTSREAFQEITQSGQRIREKQKVLDVIRKHQPVTSRSLSRILGIERTNITRSLFDLAHDTPPQIKEAYIAKCPVTGKRVKWYALADWKADCSKKEYGESSERGGSHA